MQTVLGGAAWAWVPGARLLLVEESLSPLAYAQALSEAAADIAVRQPREAAEAPVRGMSPGDRMGFSWFGADGETFLPRQRGSVNWSRSPLAEH